MQHRGLEVRGSIGPLAGIVLVDEVVLGPELVSDGGDIRLHPAVVQERLAGLPGLGDVDVAQLAGERVRVSEQPLMDVVEVREVEGARSIVGASKCGLGVGAHHPLEEGGDSSSELSRVAIGNPCCPCRSS